MSQEHSGNTAAVLGDIGSTFVKLVRVDSAGAVQAQTKLATTHHDLSGAVRRGLASLGRGRGGETADIDGLALCSSAAGGLRIVVLGFEHTLTVEAGLRTSATAGGRIVGVYGRHDFRPGEAPDVLTLAPDVALLTGGTDGGDEESILRAGEALRSAAPALPVVVAGNQATYPRLRQILGNDRPVHFVDNVMPRIGELSSGAAQTAIRRIFIEHVIGRGRFASGSAIADRVRMPTPAAVLAAADLVGSLGVEDPVLLRPMIVDVGGATTDVYSVIAREAQRGYVQRSVPDQVVTRTVEGDLGLREGAAALLQVAKRERYIDAREAEALEASVWRRCRERDFLPDRDEEAGVDERLATIAAALALQRHAGVLRTAVSPDGVSLEKTGRDLREASCLILTGGIFQHTPRPHELARSAIEMARARGALLRAVPVLRDRSYLLWAAGLLRSCEPERARSIVKATLEPVG